MRQARARVLLVWTLLFVLALGCSESGPERVVVSGTVTYLGQPIEVGLIRFVPQEAGAGPMAGAMINGGKYEVIAKGGVPVGKCRVEIKAKKLIAQAPRTDRPELTFMPEPSVQYLPAKYNTDSELTVTIEPSGEVEHNFDLE